MGIPSVGILLHEIIKLMYHAKVKNPVFFRLGTCGGIGLDGGNLVITEEAVDGLMRPYLELVQAKSIANLKSLIVNYLLNLLSFFFQPVLGKLIKRPAIMDVSLAQELKSLSSEDDPFETHVGRTMCTYDFYEGKLSSLRHENMCVYISNIWD